jgi:beta-N-acetylhexosaminidase
MSLEEKVGQLLMVQFHGEEANDDARTLIQETKVGGIIYYNWSNGLYSPEQIQKLSSGLQKLTESNPNPIPLLIAADQEGGVVTRLNHGFTKFPGNKALGETSHPKLAKEAAFATGLEMKAVGINMNLAPVVDINSNPRNPVIGVRSFGERAETVLLFAEQALSGYKQADIIATLKHFPGHGDTAIDSHEDLPIVHKSKDELEQMELLPFAKLASSSEAIMTAHILMPALDEENCSTLSKKTLDYLKQIIGFQGVIVSDSLVMDGVLKKCETVEEASIQALNAGCDILILGGKLISGERAGFELKIPDIKRVHSSIVNAVKTGRVSETRLDQAVEKILNLKNRYLTAQIDMANTVSTDAHHAIAQKIASLALKTTQNGPNLIAPIHQKNIAIFAPQLVQHSLDETSLLNIAKSTNTCFFANLNPSQDEIETAIQHATQADVLFICSYNAWKNPSQITLIQSLLDMEKPTVLLVLRDPIDASLFPNASLVFQTFSPTSPSIEAVCEQLKAI